MAKLQNYARLFFFLVAGLFMVLPASAELSPETISGATTVDATKAKSLFEQGVKFLDVRSNADFEAGRVPSAIHIELKKKLNEESMEARVSKDEPVVIYCNGWSCLRASKATSKAIKWGYSKVYYFRDGFPSWQTANFPIE
ncbi:MAG TPA: rhodanese [Rhizobiales bacterium]|nr:rhodanese [Hyphomicrobiales bacterium]